MSRAGHREKKPSDKAGILVVESMDAFLLGFRFFYPDLCQYRIVVCLEENPTYFGGVTILGPLNHSPPDLLRALYDKRFEWSLGLGGGVQNPAASQISAQSRYL